MTGRSRVVTAGPSPDGPFFLRAARRTGVAALSALALAFAAPTPPPPGTPLEDTRWVLVTLDGEAAASPEAFVLLHPNPPRRQLGGFGGCNGLKGTYDLFAGRLRVTPSALGARPCPAAAAARETKLVDALRSTANYRLEANALTLLGADGKVLATFRK